MAKRSSKPNIDPDHRYTMHEAEPLLELMPDTIKKKCREGIIRGIQVGEKKKWHVKGSEIIRLRKLWNLD